MCFLIILVSSYKPRVVISITYLLAIIVQKTVSVGFESWDNTNVPDNTWCYSEPSCNYATWKHSCQNGHQSPINIPANLTALAPPAPQDNISIIMSYQTAIYLQVYVRTGNCYAAYDDQKNKSIVLSWGNETYAFDSMHLHWGNVRAYGSEHTIGNVAYPGELHLVYYNTKKTNITQPLESKETSAILVIAVLIDTHPENRKTNIVQKLTNTLKDCTPEFSLSTGDNNQGDGTIVLRELFRGEEFAYAYSYNCSLTAPPCTPAMWLVLRRPVVVQESDVARFTSELHADKWRPNNFRPIQSRKKREIRLVKIMYM